MTEYNKRAGGGSYGARGGKPAYRGNSAGKPSFGADRSGAPSFGKKNWGDRKSSDAPFTLYKATCAECSKACEVPFRPMSGKPVYCKACFNPAGGSFKESKGGDRGGDRFPKKDFSPRAPYAPRAESGTSNDAVMKQLAIVNTKLDQLMREVAALS